MLPCSPEFKWPVDACIILLLGEEETLLEGAEALELAFEELLELLLPGQLPTGECCSGAESSAVAVAFREAAEYMCTGVGESLLPILPE